MNPIQEVLNEAVKFKLDKKAVAISTTLTSAIGYALSSGGAWVKFRNELNQLNKELKECDNNECVSRIFRRFEEIKKKKRQIRLTGAAAGAAIGAGGEYASKRLAFSSAKKELANIGSKYKQYKKELQQANYKVEDAKSGLKDILSGRPNDKKLILNAKEWLDLKVKEKYEIQQKMNDIIYRIRKLKVDKLGLNIHVPF